MIPTLHQGTAATENCQRCPLAQTRKMIVLGVGSVPAALMLVGEAPGTEEDKSGNPFVGQSGKLLRATITELCYELGTADLTTFYTNVVKCRPPENRDPRADEAEACLEWLLREIVTVKPRVILAVGRIARSDLDVAGAILTHELNWCPVILDCYHPAYILRRRAMTEVWKDQLRAAIRLAMGAKPQALDHEVSQQTSPEVSELQPWRILPEFPVPHPHGTYLAIDTETDDADPEDGIDVTLPRRVLWQASDGDWVWASNTDPTAFIYNARRVWFWSAKYDLPLLPIEPRNLGKWDDAKLIAYVLRHDSTTLKVIGPKLTGIEMLPIQTVIGSGKRRKAFSEMLDCYPRPEVGVSHDPAWIVKNEGDPWVYAMGDALVTSRAAAILHAQLRALPVSHRYYEAIEKPLVPILLEMERRGVLINLDALTPVRDSIQAELDVTCDLLQMFLPECGNLASPKQLGDALVQAGIGLTKRTEGTGQLDTSEAVLLAAVGVSDEKDLGSSRPAEIIRLVLKSRELSKLKSTYVDGIAKRLGQDGRLHARFNQMVTSTDRLSSSHPNLQNIPIRGAIKTAIRRLFTARPGYVIVKADFSQLQVRIYAEYTQEPVFLRAYCGEQEGDVHQGVADELGIPRWRAKNCVFLTLFGGQERKLAETAGVSIEDSGPFLRRVRERIPSLLAWPKRVEGELSRKGYVESLLGWREYYPLFTSPIWREQQKAIREASCLPIQATEAGIVKALMIESEYHIAERYDAELVLQVHDELVYEVPRKAAPAFIVELQHAACLIGRKWLKTVPLRLDVKVGPNWGEAE